MQVQSFFSLLVLFFSRSRCLAVVGGLGPSLRSASALATVFGQHFLTPVERPLDTL